MNQLNSGLASPLHFIHGVGVLHPPSSFDGLTGLVNRHALLHRLEQLLLEAAIEATGSQSKDKRPNRVENTSLVLVLIDVDGFRLLNHHLGHGAGDRLLQSLSHRLQRLLRPGDILSRWDNDVFAVVLTQLGSGTEATDWMQRLRQPFREPFVLGDQTLFVTAGLGMASSLQLEGLSPTMLRPDPRFSQVPSGHGSLAERLVQYAEEALNTAKNQGKASSSRFDPQCHERTRQQFALETLLRLAIAAQTAGGGVPVQESFGSPRSPITNGSDLSAPTAVGDRPRWGQLLLHYQPLVRLKTGQLEGFEALVRWQLPGRDLLSPLEFIPLAEETGLILPLGQWVLQEACQQLRRWQHHWPSAERLTMSVNLSPRELTDPGLLHRVDQILAATGVASHQLRLELTENVVMENLPQGIAALRALRQRRISLSIDDFGTGYSSLSYLDQLPVNSLKIDRSFVQRMGKWGENGEIVRAIVRMGQSLGLETVVEGVTTRRQVRYLRSLGCDMAQGSYFAMPLPAHEAIRWIAQAA
ncbi:MAG: EAL domain-containing protein [Synechococcales cyanobacterium RU_4_20]|nr:EAL domain-containing protein [Synechococcales cyanobacterium RU_4_20]NJR70108.1 EAL domain-containing protein [Synechococcales cyanobacterium CRU_2_2]